MYAVKRFEAKSKPPMTSSAIWPSQVTFWIASRAFGVTAADRATRLSGLAFDAAVWELWPYLAAGASVHVPDEETRTSPPALRDWLLTQGITIGFISTPVAEALLPLSWPASPALRVLLTGGDRLRHAPGPLPFTLVNNYGPTESTVVATSGAVRARAESWVRPASGARAWPGAIWGSRG